MKDWYTCSRFYNPLQNIWHKVKKSNELEQDFKNLFPSFACFFSQLLSKFNFWKEGWTLACVSTWIWHFLIFPNSLSLKFFRNSWGNSCIKFVILDIKYCLTCGYLDLFLITKKCQNMTSIVWALFFYSLHFQWLFNYLEKSPILAQKW